MHRELAPRKCPEFHSLAEIFPVLGEQHLEALAKDVAARGLLDEIVLCDGKILDGRCRYLACERAGVAPKFREYVGDDPLGFVISQNVHRRHLTRHQRLFAAARAAALPVGSNQNTPGLPIGRAAQVFEVSERSVARAKAVLRHGTGELIQATETGKVAVSRAVELCGVPHEVQVAKLQEMTQHRRTPRNKELASTGNGSAATAQSGVAQAANHAPGREQNFIVPNPVVPRRATGPQDRDAAYEELVTAWFKAPKLVRLKFVEEIIREP
jgi:hypothetical protein